MRPITKLFGLVLLLMLGWGCAVGPNYQRPNVAVPDAYRGEAPKAFVKLKDGKEASAAELIHFLKEKLSKLELPAEIEFRDELPKTHVGKLSRRELRAEAKR